MKFKKHAALSAAAALANTATAQDGAYGYVFLPFLFDCSCHLDVAFWDAGLDPALLQCNSSLTLYTGNIKHRAYSV